MNPFEAKLRAFALSYPDAHEDFPWEEDRVIKVRGKIFVFLGSGIGVKLTHSNQAALGLPNVKPMGYGLGRSGWVTVDLAKGRKPPIDLLKAWIDESYRTVAPKKLIAGLNAMKRPGTF
ncbi:MAG: MmcQ/YjbR family DNA-binding protein [Candidatus Dormibacter sp.]